MLSKLNLIFFLKLNVVLNEMGELFFWFFLDFFIFFTKLGLIEQGHLLHFVIMNQFFLLVKVNLLEIGTVLMSWRDVRSDFVKIRSSYEGLDLIQQLLHLHVTRKTRIHLYRRLQVGLVGLTPKNDLQHRVENHLRLLSYAVTKVSHYLPELMLTFNNCFSAQERKSHHDFAIHWVGLNENVAVWTLVISKSKSGELNFLILPLTVNHMLLIKQPAPNTNLTHFEISVDLANRIVNTIDFFAIEQT